MKIRISKSKWQARLRVTGRLLFWVGVVAGVLAGLYGLGTLVTVWDGDGNPLVLSPSLRATERYRARARDWAQRLADLDARLTMLLADEGTTDPGMLHSLSQEMQSIGEDATALAREVDLTPVPVALVGLRDGARLAADANVETAVITARWLSAPSEAGRREALEALRLARALRVQMEDSRWLQSEK